MSFLGLGAFLVGAFLLYLARRTRALARRSLAWPRVSGIVTQSQVRTERRGGGERQTTVYRADIRYDYAVTGQTFGGHQVRAGGATYGTSRKAEAVAARYPVGAAVDVAYDPAQPAAALLEPGNAAGSRVLDILGAIFALLGVGVAVAGFGAGG